MAKFKHGTWCPGISEVIKMAGIIAESGAGVTGHNILKVFIVDKIDS